MGIIKDTDFDLGDYNPKFRNGVNEYSKELKQKEELLRENVQLQNNIERDKTFLNENVANSRLNNVQKPFILSEANVRGAERAFVYKLTDIYVNSLYLDESFIEKNNDTIRNYFVSTLKENYPDISKLMESVKDNSEYLHNLVEACKKTGAKRESSAKKKLSEEDGKPFDVNEFFVSEEDKEKKQKNYADMNDQEISNIVKDKVLQVVKDEDSNNKKEQEFIDDINKAKSVNESVTVYKDGFREFSLFKGIMTKHYKDTLQTLKESGENNKYGKLSEGVNGDVEIKVDMDYVMCDAILEYTNLELLNTMKITNYSGQDIKEMANEFAYNVK